MKKKRGRPSFKELAERNLNEAVEGVSPETYIQFKGWNLEGHGTLDDLQELINNLRGVK